MNNLIKLDILDDDIYRLNFDSPNSNANLFDRETLDEFNAHLNELSGDVQMRGLVLTNVSSSP